MSNNTTLGLPTITDTTPGYFKVEGLSTFAILVEGDRVTRMHDAEIIDRHMVRNCHLTEVTHPEAVAITKACRTLYRI